MLGLGWTEMLVIGVVALIVIGPKDLPMVMNRIGKIAGQVRRMGSEFQREINKTTGLDEVRNLRSSITAPLKKTSDEIRREFNAMTPTGIKPSGVIKPADPKAESVVDEIHAAAGLPKSNDQIAAEAGFKPQIPAQSASDVALTAARKAPVRAKAVPTRPVITTDLRPVGEALDAMPVEPAKARLPIKAATKPKTSTTAPVKKGSPAKTVPVLPTEPADTPTTPAPKKPAKRSPKPKTAPDVLPHEPADTPDATATAGKE